MTPTRHDPDRETNLYRVVVAGRIGEGWVEWFGADTVEPQGDRTVLLIRVTDQAELFGRLRRIQDLNLKLLQATLVPSEMRDIPSPEGSPEIEGDTP